MAKTKLALNKFQAKLEIMTDRKKIDSSFLTTFSEIKIPRNHFNIILHFKMVVDVLTLKIQI
jgi:hypothetical protein